jgi:hypothetical protein
MRFPDVFSMRVTEGRTKQVVANVAFVLILKGLKNDYYIGPTITDYSGVCSFTRHGCEEAISFAQSMFIMDYSGTLPDCKPVAELRLHSPEHISNMLKQFKMNPEFWGQPFENPQEYFRALGKAENDAFEPFHTFISDDEMLARPSMEVQLTRR